ncbi:hypothetical protein EWM64_g2778 [Hericium alpestre]|uniref:Uncharacterized protein n=1 Tax=Hericium alpestre TaxID=135208 RepID=A0A4Z0A2H4_9AGAM|nr:hypothetical protein EWM64_g2778 [Hericium alpestre]
MQHPLTPEPSPTWPPASLVPATFSPASSTTLSPLFEWACHVTAGDDARLHKAKMRDMMGRLKLPIGNNAHLRFDGDTPMAQNIGQAVVYIDELILERNSSDLVKLAERLPSRLRLDRDKPSMQNIGQAVVYINELGNELNRSRADAEQLKSVQAHSLSEIYALHSRIYALQAENVSYRHSLAQQGHKIRELEAASTLCAGVHRTDIKCASSPTTQTLPAAQSTASIQTDGAEDKSKGAWEQDCVRDRQRSQRAELNALLPPPYRQDSHQPNVRASMEVNSSLQFRRRLLNVCAAIDYLRMLHATIKDLQRELAARYRCADCDCGDDSAERMSRGAFGR